MRKTIAALIAIALTAVASACATTQSEDVKIYSPAELRQGQYDTVARIWVDSWRTASWVPTYSSRDDGIAALRDKAASLDANGLTNVDCYGDSGLFGGSLAFTCYGKAIRVR
jgi:ABC-type glycerol-3-phosphate transport system substrate-binding protein